MYSFAQIGDLVMWFGEEYGFAFCFLNEKQRKDLKKTHTHTPKKQKNKKPEEKEKIIGLISRVTGSPTPPFRIENITIPRHSWYSLLS